MITYKHSGKIMSPVSHFKELHVVSDLHLGGSAGFQIFDNGERFERMVDSLRAHVPTERVGIVINGDFVDFLAEPGGTYFDPHTAVRKLNRIAEDPGFVPVWRALRKFVRTPNRVLAITLGNHDLELALPWIREELLNLLAANDDSARGRIHFAFDGAGFSCTVGPARVLCVHGNEADTINVTDYEQLRRIGRDVLHGRASQAWKSNAGTRLVIEVMNDIKQKYPFVDLLKPEVEAVIPTLVALDPGQLQKIVDIISPVLRFGWDSLRKTAGFLQAPEANALDDEKQSAEVTSVNSIVKQAFAQIGTTEEGDFTERLFDEVEDRYRRNERPLDLIASDEREQYLGYFNAARSLLKGKEKSEILRIALDKLSNDQRFEVSYEDSTFKRLDKLIGPEIDFVIAGHTHMERAIVRKRGPGVYFNSGTWARRIRFTPEMLKTSEHFRQIFGALSAGKLEALDKEPGLILRAPIAVSIWSEGAGVKAELRRVNESSADPVWNPLPETRYSRS
jgi:UDP-2,3-diacylglucosamine pyrophosphatase LpxH